jgi:uncharacterized protein (UPF0216 family)
MLNESAMKKWLKFEMGRINSGLVFKKKPLSDLVKSKTPEAKTKDGSVYYFNSDAISELKLKLPDHLHSLLLPITLYSQYDVKGMVAIADSPSFLVLKHLGEIPENAKLIEGKYWMGKTLANDIMKRYPTILQIIRY